jgi:hypothetical protein
MTYGNLEALVGQSQVTDADAYMADIVPDICLYRILVKLQGSLEA